ncbi:MAG: hypothetical protein EP329_08170, partial [Deltaproteobacteria bacterium]
MDRRRLALSLVGLAAAFVVLSGFRPDDPDSTGLFRFEPGYDVEAYDSDGGRVRVHFTRSGPDAVRLQDTNADGVPDAVKTVADTYEEVLTFFAGIGFRAPESDLGTPGGDGGNDRLDVYLIDFGGSSDGAFVRDRCQSGTSVCSGYVAQENDYTGYGYPSFAVATEILSSHELFHAVQAAYDADQGANWSEATATWASEQFDPGLHDFEWFIQAWFDEPKRSIDQEPIGPVDSYSYGLAIFAQFLSERFAVDLHRQLWERLEDGAHGVADPQWLPVLADLLEGQYGTSFADAWTTFADWVVRCGYGGAAGTTFANAAAYPDVTADAEALPFSKDKLRVYHASMQAWSVAPAGRARIAVALPTPDPAELEGMRLILATRDGDTVESVVLDGPAGVIAADHADEVLVLVINTLREGGSQRPGLCIGDEDEVAACVEAIAPGTTEPDPELVEVAEEEPDAGSTDDVMEEDAGGDAVAADAGADTSGTSGGKGSGGCSGGTTPGGGAATLLALAALAVPRRR